MLTVTLGDLLGHRVWNAMTEPIEIPIGVSGGGFGPLRIPVGLLDLAKLPFDTSPNIAHTQFVTGNHSNTADVYVCAWLKVKQVFLTNKAQLAATCGCIAVLDCRM